MTQLYSGVIAFEAEPQPHETRYGPRFNVAVRPDNMSAPKVQDGLIRIYRDPTHSETPYLRSLREGDRVQLIYTENGSRSYYNFVTDGDDSSVSENFTEPRRNGSSGRRNTDRDTSIWLAMNDTQLATYLTMADQELSLLTQILSKVNSEHSDLSEDNRWRMAVTIYITLKQSWRPEYITADIAEASTPF